MAESQTPVMTEGDMELVRIKDKLFRPYISETKIASRVASLGEQLTRDYKDKNPMFLPVLNGAMTFASDLLKQCPFECTLQCVRLSSYEGTESTGSVKTVMGLQDSIQGRHVVVVEDIVDSGKTMVDLKAQLESHRPASIEIVSLFVKPEAIQYPVQVKYCGFNIPKKFIVGYGLDYDQLGRNLPRVYVLAQ